ncbi:hypothetical protein [Streptomyces sp. NPDC051776]|uniref:hypothetical protein n=1 Tax=Streptomyces sp. NPDC051776 TaxID=3155414 RepID=UPI003448B007
MVGPVLAGAWCWAVVRLAVVPGEAGPLEVTIAAGGWGLSLLPVHCVPASEARAGRVRVSLRAVRALPMVRRGRARGVMRTMTVRTTTAWRRRRSGGVSDRS